VTPPPIKAIETTYAGHRFRSRLEARWAVFFDHLGMRWQYEEQGYDLPSGRYLPDFWLPNAAVRGNNAIWAEVKGRLDRKEFIRLLRIAFELPRQDARAYSPQLLVLGDIGQPGLPWVHARLDVLGDKHVALQYVYFHAPDDGPVITIPTQDPVPMRYEGLEQLADVPDEQFEVFRGLLLDTTLETRLTVDPVVDDAYRAARSARFEHGESGA
jgi:hypothetical protein